MGHTKGKKEYLNMNKNKAIRLLATSWLIAPTILSTQSAFAIENKTTTTSSLVAGNNLADSTNATTDTSTTDSSTNETEGSQEKPGEEGTTHTLTVSSSLLGKIKLTVMSDNPDEAKELTIQPNGKVEGLKEGTKVAYVITPLKDEKLVSFEVNGFEVNGAQEVNYSQKYFVVGVADLSLSAKLEVPTAPSEESPIEDTTTSTEKPAGDSSDSSQSSSSKPEESTKPSTGKDETTDSSTSQSKPSSNNNSTNTSSSSNQPSGNKNTEKPAVIENPTNDSSAFVTKTPIETTLPTNTTAVQKEIVKEALKYLGSPYVWGAKGPNTFDCSGLTYYVYMKATGH